MKSGGLSPEQAKHVCKMWNKYDADGNGIIDCKEMETMFHREGYLDGCEAPKKSVAQTVLAVDTNKNGLFEFEEFGKQDTAF